MIVFLIDADNLNSPAWVIEAITRIEATEGTIAVRRAYGSAENLKGLAEPLRDWAIRPCLNVYLSKNTTDMALAVDAMELACQAPAPHTVVIGSGDADFVPLVVRLRERGIKVVCASEYRKMAPEAIKAYDSVIYVGQNAGDEAPASKAPPAAKKVGTSAPAAKKAPAKKAAATKKTPAKPAPKAPTTKPADPVTKDMILAAIPKLRTGEWLHISDAAKVLHDKKLLGKNASSPKLFKRFPDHFELQPTRQPNQVRFIPVAA
ncbi:NYN domain-containing protein [uncultured Hydrogenophaga sp.]|uniref:NYN domain-containing protein n=1 Tax=uncultured Hydrogenophaga sp. TaxID=199683 RepID=UPI00265F6869|nr:NYN domain-containing protein [uncultured Hydrogenophaga sp.]